MTERAEGFYWVSVHDERPVVAEWDGDGWNVHGYWRSPERVAVLSPRLTPPGTAAPEPAPRLRVRWGVPVGDAPDGGAS